MSLLTFTLPHPTAIWWGASKVLCGARLLAHHAESVYFLWKKKKRESIKIPCFKKGKKEVSWPLIQHTNRSSRRKIKQVNLNAVEYISKIISEEHKYFLPQYFFSILDKNGKTFA